MPLYDFKCETCEAEYCHIMKYEDAIKEDLICDECGKPTAKKQMSTIGQMILKGDGFYEPGTHTFKNNKE
jgi:putative FmdB family regulatory protein